MARRKPAGRPEGFGERKKITVSLSIDPDVKEYIDFRKTTYRESFSTEVNKHYARLMAADQSYQDREYRQFLRAKYGDGEPAGGDLDFQVGKKGED